MPLPSCPQGPLGLCHLKQMLREHSIQHATSASGLWGRIFLYKTPFNLRIWCGKVHRNLTVPGTWWPSHVKSALGYSPGDAETHSHLTFNLHLGRQNPLPWVLSGTKKSLFKIERLWLEENIPWIYEYHGVRPCAPLGWPSEPQGNILLGSWGPMALLTKLIPAQVCFLMCVPEVHFLHTLMRHGI